MKVLTAQPHNHGNTATPTVLISNLQLFTMAMVTLLAYGHFTYVHLVLLCAGQESWVSLGLGWGLGLGILWVQFVWFPMLPGQSLTHALVMAVGKVFGTLLAGVYLCFFLFIGAVTLKELVDFLGLMYPRTPTPALLFILGAVVAWVLRAGIEVLARSLFFFAPVLVLIGLFASIATLPDKDPGQLLPLWQHSFGDIGHGAMLVAMMFSELFAFRPIAPHTLQATKIPRQGLWFMLAMLLAFIGPITGPVMMFGEKLGQSLAYPTFTEIQYIHISPLVERLDILGMFMWIFGSFFRICIVLYAAMRTAGNLFGSAAMNLYALPVTLLTLALAMSMATASRSSLHHFLLWPALWPNFTLTLAVPLLVGLISRLRGNKSPNPPQT
ncbi:hypothetical protein D2Q93_09095 [Alicyclobacillaceae bacterium I2511]|nr:hypothetical protein D2Q93_09095 [Alicyclobacillaceae bacterium I2511]